MIGILIFEFFVSVIFFLLFMHVLKKAKKQKAELYKQLKEARSDLDYVRKMMELKDESYRKADEKNRKLDNGSIHERIDAAGDVLCND